MTPPTSDPSRGGEEPRRPEGAFAFGENWQRYTARYLDPERERIASDSLVELLGEQAIPGRYFLDIGTGSGLFSLCAHQLGAARVVSIDVDADAVDSCRQLRAAAGHPRTWDVIHGSILDQELVSQLEKADIVYSWGVLHHTGDMYSAIRNAAGLVADDGLLAIAIYNRVERRFLTSDRWLHIKRLYNRAPRAGRQAMKAAYFAYWTISQLKSRANPFRVAHEYKRSRGMALMTNMWDWLGGYPYEYATVDEIVAFCERECGLAVERVWSQSPADTGNNQFLFRKS